MPVNLRNLAWLRNVKLGKDYPSFGQKLFEALSDSQTAHNQLEQQTNGNLSGESQPPPPLSALRVSGGNGIFHVSVDHNADFYRGARYHAEYATDSHFSNPFPLPMHDSREWRGHLGQQKLYFRASVSYGISSPHPQWVYFGGAQPQVVDGTSATEPGLPMQSQGSGTGYPGQGLQGPGQNQFRSRSGQPPTRVTG